MDNQDAPDIASLYGADYYATHCGSIRYDRSEPHWGEFFGKIADELIRVFRPRRVFDAGCAHGFLVEALWDRGVQAWGRDVSDFAISQTRADIRRYCSVGSLTEPIEGQYDLLTCIEVLEHMTEADGMRAIAHMTACADRVVFSSSPDDLTEPTHINVKPAIYWLRAFASHGFAPIVEVTLPSITPYAVVFERREAPPSEDHLLACAALIRARIQLFHDYHVKGALSARASERDRYLQERDQYLEERDRHRLERDQYQAERDQLQSERDRLAAERDQVAAERDQVAAERDQLEVQRDTLLDAIPPEPVELDDDSLLDNPNEDLVNAIRARDEMAHSLAHTQQQYEAILHSTSWRTLTVLQRVTGRLPPPTRKLIRRSVKLAYWTATLQLGARLRPHVSGSAPARRLRSVMSRNDVGPFDPVYYLATYPDVARSGIDPLQHYLSCGRAEGRYPTQKAAAQASAAAAGFDAVYYLRENPDVAQAGIDPLEHYVAHGASEGRFPNARAAEAISLAELCDPKRDEPGAKVHDEAFRVSVLTPAFNTDPVFLKELLQTLRNQRYGHWEWIVVDDGSSRSSTIAALREIADADPRVKVVFREINQGISAATNVALASATGTHAALVDHDDLLSRDAFLAIYHAWASAPDTQLFFTDECKLLADGTLTQFWPKPDWSPSYLENTMCLGHLSVYEMGFLRELGGFRSEYDGTQDFDLALRASLASPKVIHLPIFAYLWRIIPGSAATNLSEKHYAVERQGKAVLDYARHKHPEAHVVPGWGAGYWRIIYPLPSPAPLLSYIIPTGGGSRVIRGKRTDLILNCIRSLEAKRFYPNCEYVVIHNGDLTERQMAELRAIPHLRLIHYASPVFNFSEKLNMGTAAARGEYLCLLNDDVEVITPQGGEELVAYLAANPGVGAIGPLCLLEDETIQQNGVLLLREVGPAHAGAGQPKTYGGHQALLRCRREAFCIGGAIFFTRKDLYDRLGGYAEGLPLNYNDVDFGIRMRGLGFTCVVDPGIEAYHFESATKTGTSTVEQERMFLRHPGITDPYFSRWFQSNRIDYRLNIKSATSTLPFSSWLDRHIAERARTLVPEGRVKLSVCVSVYNQPKRLLEEMYQSVVMQTYGNKELVILDNGSSSAETLQWLDRIRKEGRAVFVSAEKNLGISGGNLKLLEAMTGDFFVAMDADDFISVDALQMLAYAIENNPTKKVFYSDEYKSDMNSSRFAPFFKPDFDPVLLTNCCYPAHLMAMKADFLREIGSYTDDRATWCHDYDTLTRALVAGEEPVHVREAIYAWRINPGSTASAATGGKPKTVDSQRFVLERLLRQRNLHEVLSVEPKSMETSSGMWSLSARRPVDDVSILSYDSVWGPNGTGVPGLAAAAEGVEWLAILRNPADRDTLRLLSAVALFDTRVNVVGGVVLDKDRRVRWSGGVFLPGGRLFDPVADLPFAEGGYHALLWCQRCVDVAAPVNVLIRTSALSRVVGSCANSADALMVSLGLDAHRRNEFVSVTPQCQETATHAFCPPLDRAGIAIGLPELASGSRWYDGRLEVSKPYKMPGLS